MSNVIIRQYLDEMPTLTLEKAKELKRGILKNYVGRDGSFIESDMLDYLGHGENSSVWKIRKDDKDYAFKVFFDGRYQYALDYEAYIKMKDLDLKKVIKAEEIYCTEDRAENQKNFFCFNAYLMQFLENNDDLNLLEMPIEKIIENMRLLEDDARMLASEKIVMDDVKVGNSIFNKNDEMLYITDIDMFQYWRKQTPDFILRYNYRAILYLFREHLLNSIIKNEEFTNEEKCQYFSLLRSEISSKDGQILLPSQRFEKVFFKEETPKKHLLKR